MRIGFVDRSFAEQYRPALDEVAFAHAQGFGAIQYMIHPTGTGRPQRGEDALDTLQAALSAADVAPTLEIMCRLTSAGVTEEGHTASEVIEQWLPFITGVGCPHVHLHPVITETVSADVLVAQQEALLPHLERGVAWGAAHGFTFAFEHNAFGYQQLFENPAHCATTLAALPDLGFVWDFNHTRPADIEAFMALAGRVTLAHVSDTPLPQVNHHLPIGMGSVDFSAYCHALRSNGFEGVMILEIGGLPISGGFGKDSDSALVDSRARLLAAWENEG